MVTNIVWAGPEAPAYPEFPIHKGLTGTAISARATINVGDVMSNPNYLTALGSTKSEIIVPIFDRRGSVVGTIDIESGFLNAFSAETQKLLEECAKIIGPLWAREPDR